MYRIFCFTRKWTSARVRVESKNPRPTFDRKIKGNCHNYWKLILMAFYLSGTNFLYPKLYLRPNRMSSRSQKKLRFRYIGAIRVLKIFWEEKIANFKINWVAWCGRKLWPKPSKCRRFGGTFLWGQKKYLNIWIFFFFFNLSTKKSAISNSRWLCTKRQSL